MNNLPLTFPETLKVVCLIKSPKKWNIEVLIKIILYYIFKYTDIYITVSYNTSILNKFSTSDCELQALLDKTNLPHTYNLLIRENTNERLEDIICHELVHLNQFEQGDLKFKDNDITQGFIWKNKEYSNKSDYFSRPWEKEARQKQYKILKEVKQIMENI